ncbi:MAG: O-methyltransferase [Anaerolineales bacterium]
MPSLIHSVLRGPSQWRQLYRDVRDRWQFEQWPTTACEMQALASISEVNLADVFNSARSHQEWPEIERQLLVVGISNNGGSNSGDSRAVYYLIRHLQPRSVLEIGTRLGATTARIALALRNSGTDGVATVTTVDIEDVNAGASWSGMNRHSPRASLEQLGCGSQVKFVTQNSLEYFSSVTAKFDLIFLDGSHDALVVYQEVPRALKVLNPGGYILLHDYYPMRRPLWEGAEPIAGPYLAIRRFQREGARVQVLPFGNLPWWTRSNSSATSLALLGAS